MMPESEIESKPGQTITKLGIGATCLYLLLLAGFATWKWGEVLTMSPNEIGDMLGGCFAPLAFLWLVLGFFQQGHELRQNVIALRIQGEELRNSVEQQRALVETTREQINLERETLADQREETARLNRPEFEFTTYETNHHGTLKRFRVSATNQGADCTGVTMKLFDGEAIFSSQTEQTLPKGATIVIEHMYEAATKISLVGKIVEIEFNDKRNRWGKQRFLIREGLTQNSIYTFEALEI